MYPYFSPLFDERWGVNTPIGSYFITIYIISHLAAVDGSTVFKCPSNFELLDKESYPRRSALIPLLSFMSTYTTVKPIRMYRARRVEDKLPERRLFSQY